MFVITDGGPCSSGEWPEWQSSLGRSIGQEPLFVDRDWQSEAVDLPPNVRLISSYHNFLETPQDLDGILRGMEERPADIYKIAVMANSTIDTLRALLFLKEQTARGKNLVVVTMGELGVPGRILGRIFGNQLIYTYRETPKAPGQLPVSVLYNTYHVHQHTRETAIYALIGDPVQQSIGHEVHNARFRELGKDAVYVKLRVGKDELDEFLYYANLLVFKGLSVTMPLKEEMAARVSGEESSCNTVLFGKSVQGFNTDGSGALLALQRKTRLAGARVALIGAGGTASSIYRALQGKVGRITVYNRTPERARAFAADVRLLTDFSVDYDILIHATSVGFGDSEALAIPKWAIQPGKVVFDVVAHPAETALLRVAKERGCVIVTGKDMFHEQAALQFGRWFPHDED